MNGGGGIVHAVADGYKPCAAMVATQCIFAAMTLWVKAAFGRGMSPVVFVVYRQAIATLVLAPVAIAANRTRLKEMRLGTKGFFLVFVAALFGVTANQNLCYHGLHLGTSSLATTMTNLMPATTFVMAVVVGQERVNIREVSSIAKIFGATVCVGGAIIIAFFKGPKLLRNHSTGDPSVLLHQSSSSSNWVMGALFLVGSSSCWSFWLILQGPICRSHVDPLTLTAWTCFLSTLQSAALALFLLPDRSAWRIHSAFELSCYAFAGVLGSGVVFYLQSWCIAARGPLYSAMFTPLCTVLTTVLSAAVLREELHVGRHVCLVLQIFSLFSSREWVLLALQTDDRGGFPPSCSLLGAVAVVTGLYVVLWGKAEDARTGRVPAKAAARSESPRDVEDALAEPLIPN